MSKPQKKTSTHVKMGSKGLASYQKWWITGLIVSMVLVILYLMIRPDQDNVSTNVQPNGRAENKTISTEKPDPKKLIGRWLRPDGGYILEIRGASPDGKLDAAYYNPKSINVGKADWVVKEGKLFVLVELRDVNYPGSTYGLEYIVTQDHLAGTYFQAVENATYDVEFVREK